MTFYRLMLRDGSSTIVDCAQAQRLLRSGKVVSIKEVGKERVFYQRRRMQPFGDSNYLTK